MVAQLITRKLIMLRLVLIAELATKLDTYPEQLKKMMGTIMTQPHLIKEATDELGLEFSTVQEAKDKLNKVSILITS